MLDGLVFRLSEKAKVELMLPGLLLGTLIDHSHSHSVLRIAKLRHEVIRPLFPATTRCPMLLSLAGNLLSALLGGLLVAVPSVWSTLRADRRERRNVASAFRGEIGAVLSLYDTRQYLSLHCERLQTWETTDEPVVFSRDFEERRYDQIYRANADRVGVLPDPIPQHIATFYTLLDAVHEDLGKMSRGVFGDQDRVSKLAFYRHFVQVMRQMLDAGKTVEAELASLITDER